jgi:hypothetical protein
MSTKKRTFQISGCGGKRAMPAQSLHVVGARDFAMI